MLRAPSLRFFSVARVGGHEPNQSFHPPPVAKSGVTPRTLCSRHHCTVFTKHLVLRAHARGSPMLNSPIAIENETTIRNLLSAFEGESNAHVRYSAFAVHADGEGLHGAASLFRAAARAEQIHAANHAPVIRQLGG